MEHYDVIIVGGGIAGCGLAYNLNRFCPEKKVLVIDRNEIGFLKDYGHRTTFLEVIEEYNLKYVKKYKGVKLGIDNKIIATSHGDLYGINYQQVCFDLFQRSGCDFKKEEGIKVIGNVIFTSHLQKKSHYHFTYLIDCSGYGFFLRKQFNLPMPFRYWVGRTRLLKNRTDLDKDFIHYFYGDNEYLEDLYVVGDKLAQGDWTYRKKIKSSINPKNSYYNTYCSNEDLIRVNGVVIPVTPVLPLTYKGKYAFLGDSFGNAMPISVYGIETILRTSKLLCDAIKQNNLRLYYKKWMKDYLNIYLKRLVIKLDTHLNSKLVKRIKDYPDLHDMLKILNKYPECYMLMLKSQYTSFELPKEVINKYPKQRVVWLIGYYIYLKLKYLKMRLLY